MKREDIEKLLGGYATGTLSEAERSALWDAALIDQTLFDALADEEALRDLLSDPAARRRLLDVLSPRPVPWWRRVAAWMRSPAGAALAATAGLAALVITVIPHPTKVAPSGTAVTMSPPGPGTDAERSKVGSTPPVAAAPAEKRAAASPPALSVGRPTESDRAAAGPSAPVPAARSSAPAAPAGGLEERRAERFGTARSAAASDEAKQAPPAPATAATAPEITWRLQKQWQGAYQEMESGSALARGDQVRLVVAAPGDGFLTVTLQTDGPSILFSGPVKAGEQREIPSRGHLPLPEQAGEIRLDLVWRPAMTGPAGFLSKRAGPLAPREQQTVAILTVR